MQVPDVDTVLEHLREVAAAKQAMLEIALAISDTYPTQAHTLLGMIRGLTRSADKLLGDTTVTG